jgi:hypothetical protein
MYRNQIAPLFEIPRPIEGFCAPGLQLFGGAQLEELGGTLGRGVGDRLSPRVFRLKQDMKDYAVCHVIGYGPTFGTGHDIRIESHCNTSAQNYTALTGYDNDTGITGNAVLAGQPSFTVEDIEVFAVTG